MQKNNFPYETAEYETIPCSFCEATDFEVLTKKDRNGLPVQSVICTQCGLIYINPRMKKEWYEKYYEKEYREQMARFKGDDRTNDYTDEYQFEQAVKRGELFLERIGSYVRAGLTIDVGSSAGGILHAFKKQLGVAVLGIEPSQEEADLANKMGIKTIVSMFENLDEEIPLADNVLSFRSLNHMLEPRAFFEWANTQLKPGGRLLLEVMNFVGTFGEYKSLHQATQIDHVYMFSKDALKHVLENLGFRVLVVEDSDELHCYIVAEKVAECNPEQDKLQDPEICKKTVKEIKSMTDSYPRYFLKYGRKRFFKKIKYKLKRLFKKS